MVKTLALIERISSLLGSEQRKRYAALGLLPVHVQVLEYLAQCNRFSNTPIAVTEYLGLTKGTVSQTLQVLVRKGYIEKKPDATDGRVVRLFLQEKAQQLLEKIGPDDVFKEAEQAVSNLRFTTINEALTATLRELQKANDSSSFGLCRTCHYFTEQDSHYLCGLTRESLTQTDAEKICREHIPAEGVAF